MHIHTQQCKIFISVVPPKEDCIIIKSGSKSHPPSYHFLGAFFKLLVILLKFYGCDKSSPVLLSEKPPKSIGIPKVCRLQKKFPHRVCPILLNTDWMQIRICLTLFMYHPECLSCPDGNIVSPFCQKCNFLLDVGQVLQHLLYPHYLGYSEQMGIMIMPQ